jgi:hypothetical protein
MSQSVVTGRSTAVETQRQPNHLALVERTNQQIESEMEQQLQGDARYSNKRSADQRVLNTSNPNYFMVRKQDFNAPNTFNLNIIKPYGRSKIRTFVTNDCKNEQ